MLTFSIWYGLQETWQKRNHKENIAFGSLTTDERYRAANKRMPMDYIRRLQMDMILSDDEESITGQAAFVYCKNYAFTSTYAYS